MAVLEIKSYDGYDTADDAVKGERAIVLCFWLRLFDYFTASDFIFETAREKENKQRNKNQKNWAWLSTNEWIREPQMYRWGRLTDGVVHYWQRRKEKKG